MSSPFASQHLVSSRISIFKSRPTAIGLVALTTLFLPPALAQISSERSEGLRDNTPRWHAITNARIVVGPGKVIERGTLVMRDGRVTAVGAEVVPPAGARVWKLDGRTVYAGFVDLNSNLGVPASLRPIPPSLPPWLRPPGMAPFYRSLAGHGQRHGTCGFRCRHSAGTSRGRHQGCTRTGIYLRTRRTGCGCVPWPERANKFSRQH
jgi:hypothetical protein